MFGRLVVDNAGGLIVGSIRAGAVGDCAQAGNRGDDRQVPPLGLALVEDNGADLARQRRKTKRTGGLDELVELARRKVPVHVPHQIGLLFGQLDAHRPRRRRRDQGGAEQFAHSTHRDGDGEVAIVEVAAGYVGEEAVDFDQTLRPLCRRRVL
jgi:hypothetical protein